MLLKHMNLSKKAGIPEISALFDYKISVIAPFEL